MNRQAFSGKLAPYTCCRTQSGGETAKEGRGGFQNIAPATLLTRNSDINCWNCGFYNVTDQEAFLHRMPFTKNFNNSHFSFSFNPTHESNLTSRTRSQYPDDHHPCFLPWPLESNYKRENVPLYLEREISKL